MARSISPGSRTSRRSGGGGGEGRGVGAEFADGDAGQCLDRGELADPGGNRLQFGEENRSRWRPDRDRKPVATYSSQPDHFASDEVSPAECPAYRYYTAAGGLASYGPDPIDAHKRAAGYVDRILKARSHADLPVQVPTRYALVINLKTAKTLGLTVSPSLLARADEVIE